MNYGVYRAKVVDNKDPEKKGRIQVECPPIYGNDKSDWGLPCMMPGAYFVPEEDSLVWITFEGGDVGSMVWLGEIPQGRFEDTTKALYQNEYSEEKPQTYGIEFPKGSKFKIKEDEHDSEAFIEIETKNGEKLRLGSEGYVELSDGKGASIIIENGKITLTGESVLEV